MAYNYPQFGYPQFGYQQPMYQPQMQTQVPQDDRTWVANEAAANAYMVAANSGVILWDSSKPVFYEKRADSMGKQFPMVAYDYSPRNAAPAPGVDMTAYVTRQEFDEAMKKLKEAKDDAV